MEDRERLAFEAFKARVDQVGETVESIERDLARRDVFLLAGRCREAIRTTKDLLDKNMTILFEGQPAHLREDLYDSLRFAEGHVIKALSDEVSFQQMDQRLYLAAQLTADVIVRVTAALNDIERELQVRHPWGR